MVCSILDLGFPSYFAAMDVAGLSLEWDNNHELRDRTRRERKINVHPASQKFSEATRSNCTDNAMVLLPALLRLARSPKWKLPHLEPLQVELSKFYEKLGIPLEFKLIYTGSVEIKKMLGFTKRRVMRKEVTKDQCFENHYA